MSQLIYNNVNLSLVKTNSITRIPRMSDDLVDYMWTDFIIDVNFIYSPGATSYPVPGVLPMETDSYIRSILVQPRASLYYSEGGLPILSLPPNLANGGAIDCEDGPKVLACDITRIGSSRIFFGRFVVKVAVIECAAGTVIPSAIASSRYMRTESIGPQYLSTMTVAGRAYFRSNVLVALSQNADAFRGYIIPNAMLGFQRKQVQVSIDPSGLIMEFMAVDAEQIIDLGSTDIPGTAGSIGIVEMDMDYQTSSVVNSEIGIAGMVIRATASGMAVGQANADTFSMMQFLIVTLFNKLGLITDTGMPIDISVSENIFKKVVSASITYQTLPRGLPPQPVDFTIGINGIVGQPVLTLPDTGGIDPFPPSSNATRGATAYQLAVGALGQSCIANLNTVGGCDQTGAIPPDLNGYNGQCQGFPSVIIFQPYQAETGTDFRQTGKGSFRGPDPLKTAYMNYSIRDDDDTLSGLVAIPTAPPMGSPYSLAGGSLGGPQPGDTQNLDPLNLPPGSSIGNPSVIVLQLFQPMTTRTVSFTIERYGCVVEPPSPTPTQAGSALLKAVKSPVGIELAADGYTPIYRMSGVYTYSKTYPTLDTDTLPFSIPAWVYANPNAFTEIIAADFQDGIINNPPV